MGRAGNAASYYKDDMEAAGFFNVVEETFYWPLNPWPKDRKLKELGKQYLLTQSYDFIDTLQVCGVRRTWKRP